MTENPFYSNYLWKIADLNRMPFSKWHWVWLWLYPTYVQAGDGGWFFSFKLARGKYWFIGACQLLEEENRGG